MKTAGIIGGIGPESTIEYYRLLVAGYRDKQQDGTYPPIIINSIDLKRMLALIAANDLDGTTSYLVTEVRKLAAAGADFGLMAANTPHIVFDEILRESPIPLISIVQATCDAAVTLGLKKLGLFGTRFTMQAEFYQKTFFASGMMLSVPEPDDQTFIHNSYMDELVQGIFLQKTRDRLLTIADRMIQSQGIQGLILGGTELPLVLRDVDAGIPFLDTTRIHVDAVLNQLLS